MLSRNSKSLLAAPRSYVFAICGDAVHVNSLNLSLRYLRKFSGQQILVVTDLSRTPEKIKHDCIIDVRTPEHLDDHQASIFLKTSLHRTLPANGTLYCYLDSDVIAVRSDVDGIFEQMQAPIMFAPDHCHLSQFGPLAMHCDCSRKYARRDQLKALVARFSPPLTPERRARLAELQNVQESWSLLKPRLQELRDCLRRWYSQKRTIGWHVRRWQGLTETVGDFVTAQCGFVLDSSGKYWLDEEGRFLADFRARRNIRYSRFLRRNGFVFHPLKREWRDLEGNLIQVESVAEIERHSDFRFDRRTGQWLGADGTRIYRDIECNHLQQAIEARFRIRIADADWQHWNGGVFLFDETSHDFLDTWHAWSIQVFDDPQWQTRDQGTLVAAAWHHGLQNHPMLSSKFNLIADYYKPTIRFSEGTGFRVDHSQTVIKPSFVHIYHHWEDEHWPVWRWIQGLLNEPGTGSTGHPQP